MHDELLREIDSFLSATGMSDFRFGLVAARNGRLVKRLRSGGRIWPETEAKVRSFIRTERVMRKLPAPEREGAA